METLEQYPSRAAEIPIFDREMQSEDTCNAAILVVIKASDALRADLESFSEHRPYPESSQCSFAQNIRIPRASTTNTDF